MKENAQPAFAGTCEAPCSAFRVVGDHPSMLRPDKVFRGENAQARANDYASVLSDQGYENVAVEPLPNAHHHGTAAPAGTVQGDVVPGDRQ